MFTREKAQELGENLLNKMRGNGWKLRVWENLGWHYCVTNKNVSVSEYFFYGINKPVYHCLIGYGGAGIGAWTTKNSCDDPNVAVEQELAAAHAYVNELQEIIENVESIYL